MSSVLVRSRLASALSRRCISSDAPSSFHPAHNESIVGTSRTLVSDRALPSSQGAEAPEARKPWSFLKYTLIAAFTGVTATAGYASYAYSLREVDEKTRAFRDSANYTSADSDSTLDNLKGLLYSAVMKVPAKGIELYLDLRKVIEEQIHGCTEPTSDKLLPDLHPLEQHVFTLVLDLNETLVYSDWKRDRGWRTFKRPGVDAFLEHLAKFYEIVIYSDQLNIYVDPQAMHTLQAIKGC